MSLTPIPAGASIGVPIPQGATIGQKATTPPASPLASIPEGQLIEQGMTGLKETGGDIWDTVKGMVVRGGGGGAEGAGEQAYDSIKNVIPVLHAYETARGQGKGVVDSLTAANEQAKAQNESFQNLQARMDEFKKNPTAAQVRLVGDAVSAALAFWGGEKISSAIGGADTEESVAKPGIVQKIAKGKDVAQPAAEEALRSGVKAGGAESGLSTVQPESLRTAVEEPIQKIHAQAKANYAAVDKAAGTDFKALSEKLDNTEYQMRQLTDTEKDAEKWVELEKSRDGILEKIEYSKGLAQKAGVDPKLLDQADQQFKQANALRDVEAKIFKSPSVIKGNAAMGAPESINIDSAVRAAQRLQDNTKFGAPRLEQAFGKEGANRFLQELYEAQRQGIEAMKVQKFAKLVGGIVGGLVLSGAAGAAAKEGMNLLQ